MYLGRPPGKTVLFKPMNPQTVLAGVKTAYGLILRSVQTQGMKKKWSKRRKSTGRPPAGLPKAIGVRTTVVHGAKSPNSAAQELLCPASWPVCLLFAWGRQRCFFWGGVGGRCLATFVLTFHSYFQVASIPP